MGTTWQVIANLLAADKVPIKTVLPKEGSTGWSDTWMLSSKAQHPNCMAQVDELDRDARRRNAQVAEWFGEAPANLKACEQHGGQDATATRSRPDDEQFYDQVKFWATPTRTAATTAATSASTTRKWVQAWTDIKG